MKISKKKFLLGEFIYYNIKFIEYKNEISFFDSIIIWPFFIKRPLWIFKYKKKSISVIIDYIKDKRFIIYNLNKEKFFWKNSFYYSNSIGKELDNRLFILYKQLNIYIYNISKFLRFDINEILYRKYLYNISLYNLTGITFFFDFFIESYISIYWRLNSLYFCIKWWFNVDFEKEEKKENEIILQDYIIVVNLLRYKKKNKKISLWNDFLDKEHNLWKEKFFNYYFFKNNLNLYTFSCYYFFNTIQISFFSIYNLYFFNSIYFLYGFHYYKYTLYDFFNFFNKFLQLNKYKNFFLISYIYFSKFLYNKYKKKKNAFINRFIKYKIRFLYFNFNFILIYKFFNYNFTLKNLYIKIKLKLKYFKLYIFLKYLYIYCFLYFFELKFFINYNLNNIFLSMYFFFFKKKKFLKKFLYFNIKQVEEKQIISKNLLLNFNKDVYNKQFNNFNLLKYSFIKKIRLLYHSKRVIKIGFISYKKWIYKKIKEIKKKEKLPDYRFRRYDLDWNFNRSLLIGQNIKLYDFKKTRLDFFYLQSFFFEGYLKELLLKQKIISDNFSLSYKYLQLILKLLIKLKNKLIQYNLWVQSYISIYNNLYDYFFKNSYEINSFFEYFFDLYILIYKLFNLTNLNFIEKFKDLQFIIKKYLYKQNNSFFDFSFFFKIQKRILFAQHYYYIEDYMIRSLVQNKNFFFLFFADLSRYYRLFIYDIFLKKKKKSIYEKYFNKLFFLYLYNYLEFDIYFFKLQFTYYWYLFNYIYNFLKNYKSNNNDNLFFFNIYNNSNYLFWEYILGEFSYTGRQWNIFLKEWSIIKNIIKKKKKIYFYYKPNKYIKKFREIYFFNREISSNFSKFEYIYEYYNYFYKLNYNIKIFKIYYNLIYKNNYKSLKYFFYLIFLKKKLNRILIYIYMLLYKRKFIYFLRRQKIKGLILKKKSKMYLKAINMYFNKYLLKINFINRKNFFNIYNINIFLYKYTINNLNYLLYIYINFFKDKLNYFFFLKNFLKKKNNLIYKEWNLLNWLKIKKYIQIIKKKKINIKLLKKISLKKKNKKFINLYSFFQWHFFFYKSCIYYKWFYSILYKWLFICLFFLKTIGKFLIKQKKWKKLIKYNYFDDIYKLFLNLRYKNNENFMNLSFYEKLKLYFFDLRFSYKYFFFFCTIGYSTWWYKYYNFIAFYNYLNELYIFENDYIILYDYLVLFFCMYDLKFNINIYQFDNFSHITRFLPVRLYISLKKRFFLRVGIYFYNFLFYFSLFLLQNINYFMFSFYIIDKFFFKKNLIFFFYITDLYTLILNFLYVNNISNLYTIKNLINFSSFFYFIYNIKKYNGLLWYSSLNYKIYIDYISKFNKIFRLSCSFICFLYINLEAYLKLNFKIFFLQEKKYLNFLKNFFKNLNINDNKVIIKFNYTFMPFFYKDYIRLNFFYNEKKIQKKKKFFKPQFDYFLSKNVNLFFIKNSLNTFLQHDYLFFSYFNKKKQNFIKFLNNQYNFFFKKFNMKIFLELGFLHKKKLIPKNITKIIRENFFNLFLSFLYNQLDFFIDYDFSFLDCSIDKEFIKKSGRKEKSNLVKFLEYLYNYELFLKNFYVYDGFWLFQKKKEKNKKFVVNFLEKKIYNLNNKIDCFIKIIYMDNWLYFLKNIIEKKNFLGLMRGIFSGVIDYIYCLDNLYKIFNDFWLINNIKIFFFCCKKRQKFILKYYNLYNILLNFSYLSFDLFFFNFYEDLDYIRKDSWFLIFIKKNLNYINCNFLEENLSLFNKMLYYKEFCDLILFKDLYLIKDIFFYGFYLQIMDNSIKLNIGYNLITFLLVFLSIIKYKKEQCYYIVNDYILLFTFDDIYNFYKHICVQLYIFYYFTYNKKLFVYYNIIKKAYYFAIYKKIKKLKLKFTRKKLNELFFFSLKNIKKKPLNTDFDFWLNLLKQKQINKLKIQTITSIINTSFLKVNF
jgi:hypothetical protein